MYVGTQTITSPGYPRKAEFIWLVIDLHQRGLILDPVGKKLRLLINEAAAARFLKPSYKSTGTLGSGRSLVFKFKLKHPEATCRRGASTTPSICAIPCRACCFLHFHLESRTVYTFCVAIFSSMCGFIQGVVGNIFFVQLTTCVNFWLKYLQSCRNRTKLLLLSFIWFIIFLWVSSSFRPDT